MKKALICGVSGQDGAYLAHLLLEKGYHVTGSSRDATISSFQNLSRLGIKDQIELISIAGSDFRSVLQALVKVKPDEIYNLAGQSSVGLSFDQPIETFDSITVGTLNFLEAIRFLGLPVKFYNAGSSESFGNTGGNAANEITPFRPRSPYAVAKAASFWYVDNYREAYHLFACSGILFNHESPLRPERFVTQKIVSTARKISEGSKEKLCLGNMDIIRDWGWAPEYVAAMWKMLQMDQPDDFVIATGQSHSLQDFVKQTFDILGLDWRDHVASNPTLYRPTDIAIGRANPDRAKNLLAWEAETTLTDVIRKMLADELF